MRVSNIVVLIFCLAIGSQVAGAYRFLVIQPVPGYSHNAAPAAIAYGLARKGHDVTMVTPTAAPKEKMPTYHHLQLANMAKADQSREANHFEQMSITPWDITLKLESILLMLAKVFFEEQVVIDLMRSNQTFDAVICEVFQSDIFYGFSEHFNAPLIGVAPFGDIAWNTDLVGSASPPSYIPNTLLPISSPMNLQTRIANLMYIIFERGVLEWSTLPKHEALYEKYFPHAKRSLREVRSNTALVLLNTHFSFGLTRPFVPNQIEVGGMHIKRTVQPLSVELQEFMDGAEDGVIYFSMGSYLRSKFMPATQRQAILNSFRGLKQRVVWKFEDTSLEDKPDNVFISPWLPQTDVLAHPNVRLFITHGGVFSVIEAVYHGVPILGLPIYGDQPWNIARAQRNGYGYMLDFAKLTEQQFRAAIKHVLNTPSFKQEMSLRSAQYRDQPLAPLDLAIYWSERVARHGQEGVKRLHCPGQDMSFIAYHNIDAWFVLIGAVVGILLLLVAMVRGFLRTVRSIFGGDKSKSKTE